MRMKIPVLMAAMVVLVQSGLAQQPAGPPVSRTPAVRSSDVHPDRRVTFRIDAPKATEVTVSGEFEVGAPAHKLSKDAQGIWSVTVGPFEPEQVTGHKTASVFARYNITSDADLREAAEKMNVAAGR